MPNDVVPDIFLSRRRVARAAALASSGLLVGFSASAAVPAVAATESDCDDSNTVSTATHTQLQFQALLDDDTVATVCLAGTFPLTSALTFDRTLTLYGLSGAELDGGLSTGLLIGSAGAGLTVQNIAFTDGTAPEGAAIYSDGPLTVMNSTFTGNSAFDGGAIFNVAGSYDTQIIDSVFTGNEAQRLGGAVYADVVLIGTSTFSANTAQGGGAVYGLALATLESTFTDNEAVVGGAIWALDYGAVMGSTFADNLAEAIGGAVASYGAGLSLNSTFVSNEAGDVGGAIYTSSGIVGLSTFLENRADAELPSEHSEAIYTGNGEDGLTIFGSIFAGSRPNAQVGSETDGAVDDSGGNIFSTTAAQETALGAAHPSTLFGRSVASIFGPEPALGDNGGETQTVALVEGSPAIDAVPDESLGDLFLVTNAALTPAAESWSGPGDLSTAVTSVTVDQRDVERTGIVDAGAFEYGDAELAATGVDSPTTGWLATAAAVLLGLGAAGVAIGRRYSRR